jgi:hypothetical protein
MFRQTQNQHPSSFQPMFDSQINIVARLNRPFIKPDPQTLRPQAFRQASHPLFVINIVAQENIERKSCAHVPPVQPLEGLSIKNGLMLWRT